MEFADPMPENIPDPETLTSAKELMQPYAGKSPFANYYAEKSPFDIRHVTRDHHAWRRQEERQRGFRQADGVDEGRRQGGRAAGHASCDAGDGLRPDHAGADSAPCRTVSIATPGISYASIDHSMWWYRDIDINQWHLYVQDTPTAAHGRGLGQAKVYTQDGELVACMAQEAMFRVPKKD